MEYHLPLALVVSASWISFWLDYRSTPARVTLPVTTFLTLINMAENIRSRDFNFQTFSTVLEIYISVCTLYVFGALVEYAIVGGSYYAGKKVRFQHVYLFCFDYPMVFAKSWKILATVRSYKPLSGILDSANLHCTEQFPLYWKTSTLLMLSPQITEQPLLWWCYPSNVLNHSRGGTSKWSHTQCAAYMDGLFQLKFYTCLARFW